MRFFIDMDGALARFHDEVQYLERMYERGFFLNLKPFEEAVRGINELAKTHEVYILSAVVEGEPPYCADEKHRWIDKWASLKTLFEENFAGHAICCRR